MIARRFVLFFSALAFLPAFPALPGAVPAGDAGRHELRIVTSFYPVYITTLNIVRDVPGVQVANLTQPFAGCLHDYQMTPGDLKTLSGAGVFIVNGAGMESFLDKATAELKDMKTIDASRGISLIEGADGPNPHVWLSVVLLTRQVENVVAGLSALDKANGPAYRRNGDVYIKKLEDLRARMQAGLAAIKSRGIVTFHEAFPYFAREFNFDIKAVVEREPGSEPNARELAETIQIIRKNKIPAIFIEPQYPDKSARAIARETGAAVCVLDPAVTGPMREDAYLRIMESNLAVLVQTLNPDKD